MYKFTTIKCSGCGAVIYNLPETEAKKLRSFKLKCEDCRCNNFFKDFGSEKVSTVSIKEIRYSVQVDTMQETKSA